MATTPQLLKAGGAAVTLTALLLMLAAIVGARTHRYETLVIGRDSTPLPHIDNAASVVDMAIGLDSKDPRRRLLEKLATDLAEHRDTAPDVDALDKVNRDAVETEWTREQEESARVLAMTIGSAILLGLSLVSLQILMTRRTHRVINPGLFLATIFAWIFMVFSTQSFNKADRDLRASNTGQALTDVANFEEIAPGVTISVVALTWLGLRPRIKEYAA